MNPIDVIGQDRIELYNKMNYPLSKALSFFAYGDRSQLNNLIGAEFQVQTERQLKPIADYVESEVVIGNSSIDIVAGISGFKHTYENKAVRDLSIDKKVLKQITKAKGHYNDSRVLHHVVVLKDTNVPEDMEKQIKSIGADLIRSNISREDLINELFRIQRIMYQ